MECAALVHTPLKEPSDTPPEPPPQPPSRIFRMTSPSLTFDPSSYDLLTISIIQYWCRSIYSLNTDFILRRTIQCQSYGHISVQLLINGLFFNSRVFDCVLKRVFGRGTALHFVCESHKESKRKPQEVRKVIQLLTQAFGTDLHVTDEFGETPAHRAALAGNLVAFKKLHELGADVFYAKNKIGQNPIAHTIAQQSGMGILKFLLRLKPELATEPVRVQHNTKNVDQECLGHVCVLERSPAALRICATLCPKMLTRYGESILNFAISMNCQACVKMLRTTFGIKLQSRLIINLGIKDSTTHKSTDTSGLSKTSKKKKKRKKRKKKKKKEATAENTK